MNRSTQYRHHRKISKLRKRDTTAVDRAPAQDPGPTLRDLGKISI